MWSVFSTPCGATWPLAKRLRFPNFRQLALAGDLGMLGPESPWENAFCLAAIKRQYVEAATGEADGLATCTDLMQAAGRGDTHNVIELLETPHDPNAADRDGHMTPAIVASANRNLEVVQCLLDSGADKEKADNRIYTVAYCCSARPSGSCPVLAGCRC
ncbi:unnamed protein product [Effrenium voratum]|nr:unnamed protein product [Effrenium voratum]